MSKVGGVVVVVVAADYADNAYYMMRDGERRPTRTATLISQKLQEGWVPPEYADPLAAGVGDGIMGVAPLSGAEIPPRLPRRAAPIGQASEGVAPSGGLPARLQGLRPGDSLPDGLEIVVRGSNNKPGTFSCVQASMILR